MKGDGFMLYEYLCGEFDDYSDYVPKLEPKFRQDAMKFNKGKLGYDEVTKCVIENGRYVPLFVTNNRDNVVDLFPLVNIGAAEILANKDLMYGDGLLHMLLTSINKDIDLFEDDIEIIDCINTCRKLTFCSSVGHALSDLRRTRLVAYHSYINKVTKLLNLFYIIDKQLYFSVLFDIMAVCYDSLSPLYTKSEDLCMVYEDEVIEGNSFKIFEFDYRKIGYKVPGKDKKNYITDATGAGICAFALLTCHLYNSFCDFSSRNTNIDVDDDKTYDVLNKHIFKCLGNDTAGRYFSGKRVFKRNFYKDYDDEFDLSDDCKAGDDSVHVVDNSVVYEVGDECYTRVHYETDILNKKTNKVTYKKVSGKSYRSYNPYYFGKEWWSFLAFAFDKDFDSSKWFNIADNQKMKSVMLDIMKNELDSTNQELIDEAKDKISYLEDENKQLKSSLSEKNNQLAELESLRSQVRSLEQIVSTKSKIIDDMEEQIKSYKIEINSTYSDVNIDEQKEDSDDYVSPEEMVEFLKDFKIGVVGGRYDFDTKLEALNLNITQMNTTNRSYNYNIVDFIVINTKFVSHQNVDFVRSFYKNKNDMFMYYNGTNVDNFVSSLYDFINNWMLKAD